MRVNNAIIELIFLYLVPDSLILRFSDLKHHLYDRSTEVEQGVFLVEY